MLLAFVFCVVDADYIRRLKPFSWVFFFVDLLFLDISCCCYVVLCNNLLHSLLMDSVHTVAAYSRCGSIAPLFIVFSASCLTPQAILADLDSAFISSVHLPVMYFICSLNVSLLSIIIPKYFILSTCSRWFLFRYISIAFLSLRLLDISMTFDF